MGLVDFVVRWYTMVIHCFPDVSCMNFNESLAYKVPEQKKYDYRKFGVTPKLLGVLKKWG